MLIYCLCAHKFLLLASLNMDALFCFRATVQTCHPHQPKVGHQLAMNYERILILTCKIWCVDEILRDSSFSCKINLFISEKLNKYLTFSSDKNVTCMTEYHGKLRSRLLMVKRSYTKDLNESRQMEQTMQQFKDW